MKEVNSKIKFLKNGIRTLIKIRSNLGSNDIKEVLPYMVLQSQVNLLSRYFGGFAMKVKSCYILFFLSPDEDRDEESLFE